MKKINFENLPSTNTPINATNLNLIQSNVEEVLSGTEPMGNIVVSDIKCKNLLPVAEIETITANKGVYIDLPAGTYTLSVETIVSNGTNGTYVFAFIGIDNSEKYVYLKNNLLTVSFTTDIAIYKVSIYSEKDWASSQNITTTYTKLMLEKGSEATEYTNYKKYDLNTYEIPVTISDGNTYQNDLLKNAKFVVVNWMPADGSWSMQTLHVQNGYSLNTYGSYSAGSVFNSTDGTIKYNYSTDANMNITKILIIK